MVRTFGTGKVSDLVLADKVKEIFPLKPKDIIEYFGLKRPIYLPTATYGHFGGDAFPWEQVDKVDALLCACQG
jgi:S-adenosylmethionine synthetase